MSSDGSPKNGLNVPMILLPTLRTISGRRSSMSGDPLLTPDDSNVRITLVLQLVVAELLFRSNTLVGKKYSSHQSRQQLHLHQLIFK